MNPRRFHPVLLSLLLLAFFGVSVAAAQSTERNPVRTAAAPATIVTDRLIVGLQSSARPLPEAQQTAVAELAARVDLPLRWLGDLGSDLVVLQLRTPVTADSLAAAIALLAADPGVAFVEPDRRRQRHLLPNDPLYAGQWYLQGVQPSAVRAEAAWDSSTGSSGVVVAVLDTGVRFDHPDLERATNGGRLLPGYDFVSGDRDGKFTTANDGDGRDPDASDPGDWVTTSEAALDIYDGNCDVQDSSSWHGTRVAGIIGARSNNAQGIAGVTWRPWILPVRVLGKCGGYDSDILAGMRWAAGLAVTSVPDNPYPARVMNLSLGSMDACPASYQMVINELLARGTVVVASAGNESGPIAAPANCAGVVAVVALRHSGTKVGFSSLGSGATLGAPGGNCVNVGANEPCLYSIDTTTNLGATAPGVNGYTDAFNINVGTSFSAPIVAGVAALMLSANPRLPSAELVQRLRSSSRPYPSVVGLPVCRVPSGPKDLQRSECVCTTAACGAGIADAPAALAEARRPLAVIAVPATVAAATNLMLDASASSASCGRSLQSYAWVVTATGSGGALLSGSQSSTASIRAPSAGTLQIQLTVTDDRGERDSTTATITATNATSETPVPVSAAACPTEISFGNPAVPNAPPQAVNTGGSTGGGGGGGGSFGWSSLLALFFGALLARRGFALSRRWPSLPR
jgi:serine protease